MKRNGSMTLIASLFLTMVVGIILLQMHNFHLEQQQRQTLIIRYQHKLERIISEH